VPNPELRVFLDTNVIFSGLYSSRGAPAAVLEYFSTGRIRVIVSQQVLEELIRTFKAKLPEGLPALKRLLLNAAPEVCAGPSAGAISRWAEVLQPGDAAILAAAVAAEADYLVTGDNHFLENPGIMRDAGIKIITPAQLVKMVE
jgi:uncharacterized protein